MKIEEINEFKKNTVRSAEEVLEYYALYLELESIVGEIRRQHKENGKADAELVQRQTPIKLKMNKMRGWNYNGPLAWILFKTRMHGVDKSEEGYIVNTLAKLRSHARLTGDEKVDNRGCAGKLRFIDNYLERLGFVLEDFIDENAPLDILLENEKLIELLATTDFGMEWERAQEGWWKEELAELDKELENTRMEVRLEGQVDIEAGDDKDSK